MKRQFLVLSGCFLIFSTAFAAPLTAQNAPAPRKNRGPITTYSQSKFQISLERAAMIRDILDKAIKQNRDITKPNVIALLETEIAMKMPLVPKVEISNKPIAYFSEQAKKMVNEMGQGDAEKKILEKLRQEAEKKYPLVAPRTPVKLQYKRGNRVMNVEGIFYSANDRYIQINNRKISCVDLTDEQRARYDAKFNAALREEYVNAKMQDHVHSMGNKEQELFTKLLAEQDITNEKNGYIFDRTERQWLTAKEYFNKILPTAQAEYHEYVLAQAKKRAEEEARQRAQREKDIAENGGVSAIDTSNQERYEEVIKDAKAKRAAVDKKFSGIDAYQGYNSALWNTSPEEVAYLFSKLPGTKHYSTISYDKIVRKGTFPAEVFFYFRDNKLYRTVEFYGALEKPVVKEGQEKAEPAAKIRVLSAEAFSKLLVELHDLCGSSDEEKNAPRRNLFEEITDGELTPEKLHPPREGEEMPYEFSFTWTGSDTTMKLTFEYDYDSDSYSDVKLDKVLQSAAEAIRKEELKK